MAQLFVAPQFQALNGVASLPGAKLEFFTTGTTTQTNTFSDIGLTTANANPVIADGNGIFGPIFAEDFSVIKAVLTDTNDVLTGFEVADPASGDQVTGQFQTFNTVTNYSVGDIVQGSDAEYSQSIVTPNTGNDPTTTATAWSQIVLVVEFNTNETYALDDTVRASDGKLYTSLSAINTGNDPTTDDGTNWDKTLTMESDFVTLKSGRENLIINGNGVVGQRDVIGTSIDDAKYGIDRWIVLSDGNGIVTPSQETSDLPTDGTSAMKYTVDTADAKFGMLQIVEASNSKIVIDSIASLSSSARADGLSNLRVAIISWTGSADSPTTDAVGTWNASGVDPTLATNWVYENTPANISLSTSWQSGFDALNVSVDTASTKQIGIFIWVDDTDANIGDVLHVTNAQVEPGAFKTNYQQRSTEDEQIRSKRFYQQDNSANSASNIEFQGDVTSANFYLGKVWLPVEMRTIPAVVLSPNGATNFSNLTTGTVTANVQAIREVRQANGTGQGQFQTRWTADAELGV